MAQEIINNGESGLIVRGKLNANFTELYTGKDSVTVATFALLPDPTTVTGQKYWVLTSTGVFLVNRRSKGAYYSDGATWNYLGDFPTTADQIGNVPAGVVTATDVQAAINQVATSIDVATGWGSYVNTAAAQTIVAATSTALVNNAGTVIETQKPADIATFYTLGKITGRNGDGILINIELTFTPSSTLASYLRVAIDIGGVIGEIYIRQFSTVLGMSVPHSISYSTGAYSLDTWQANGGTIKVFSDGPGSITGVRYVIHRLHKA